MKPAMHCIREGLNFPTGLVVDSDGIAYVVESGLSFAGPSRPARLLRVDGSHEPTVICDDFRAPVNGLHLFEGYFYVAEGGSPGRISRVDRHGNKSVIVDNLPGDGSYHTNMAVVGRDRKLYFGQGAMTNSGIAELEFSQSSGAADLPGMAIVLADGDRQNGHCLDEGPSAGRKTGAFATLGHAHPAGTHLPAQLPCTCAIMRCNLDGSDLQLVAWGLRNPYGLGFSPAGHLLALDLGINDRGVRPIGQAPSCLYVIEQGAWYGWPDYVAGVPVDHDRFLPSRGTRPRFLLANHHELPVPKAPLVEFPARAAAVKFETVGDQLYVALFGDKRPFSAPPGASAGRTVVRVDPRDWSIHAVIGDEDHDRLHRPIDLSFNRHDKSLYVLDFGEFEMESASQTHASASSGKIWRIDLERTQA